MYRQCLASLVVARESKRPEAIRLARRALATYKQFQTQRLQGTPTDQLRALLARSSDLAAQATTVAEEAG